MVDLQKAVHSSLYNYQQIYLNDTTTTTNGTRTVPHALGYLPYARIWAEQIAGEVSPIVVSSTGTVYHSDYQALSVSNITRVALNTNDLLIDAATADTKTVYYRIYVDHAS